MPIRRSSYQSDQTLEEFYLSDDWGQAYQKAVEELLSVVKMINALFHETDLVASTSHQRLCIQDVDDERLHWVVIIDNVGLGEYYFSYRVPEHKSPWEDAWMHGTAKGLDQAKLFLVKSMVETEAWQDNAELERLAAEYL